MNKIPTAEEFLNSKNYWHSEDYAPLLIEFAKLHVKQALKTASENFKIKLKDNIDELNMNDYWEEVDKDSILNAYPLTNIK